MIEVWQTPVLLHNGPMGRDDILLPNGPPFSQGPPVLDSPCPPPGNYGSQYQRLVKKKGIIYSKLIQA